MMCVGARRPGRLRRRGRRLTLVVLLAAVLEISGCSSGGGHPTSKSSSARFGIVGVVVLPGAGTTITYKGVGTRCLTLGNSPIVPSATAFDDVRRGAQVVVTDAAGTTLALGKLGAGVSQAVDDPTEKYDCRFPFTINGIPGGQSRYGVQVADQDAVRMTAAQMRATPVTVHLDR